MCEQNNPLMCRRQRRTHKLLPLFFVTPSGYRFKLVKYSFAHGNNSTPSSTYLPQTDATKL